MDSSLHVTMLEEELCSPFGDYTDGEFVRIQPTSLNLIIVWYDSFPDGGQLKIPLLMRLFPLP